MTKNTSGCNYIPYAMRWGKMWRALLHKGAQIGYNSVEAGYAAGKYYGQTPADFAALLKQNGLIMPSCHYTLGEGQSAPGTILTGWDKAVEDAASIGQKYMVCA